MRLFIAINFPSDIKAAIAKVRDKIKNAALRGSFSLDENLHLTLVFIGECDRLQTEEIKEVMDSITFSPFMLKLNKAGYFNCGGGDVWWVGLKESAPLLLLQSELEAKLRQSGLVLESRRFAPHITLGREVKVPAGFIAPKTVQAKFSVVSIELMKSEHINGKLTYTQIYSKGN